MKHLKKIALLAGTFLLSGCSLGASKLSLAQFKEILNKEVKPTVVTDVTVKGSNVSTRVSQRDIEKKTLVEDVFKTNAAAYSKMISASSMEGGLSISATYESVDYVTKEIINAAGVKTFSDVEKKLSSVTYSLKTTELESGFSLDTVTKAESDVITTDYLSIELNPDDGKIASAKIIVDDNLYAFSTKDDVVFDTFTKKEATPSEEEEDDTPEAVVVSLAGTTWTLSDSTGAHKNAVIEISEEVDSVASSTVKVGTLTYNEIAHDLFVFEQGDGSYNFEVRQVAKAESEVVDSISFAKTQDDIDTIVKPAITNFLENANVATIINGSISYYGQLVTFMEETANGNYEREILARETGIAYRVIEQGVYFECILDEFDEDRNVRPIKSFTTREGLNGNEILTYNFAGF